MITKIQFKFIDRDYEIISIHVVEFPTFTNPVEQIHSYFVKVKSEYPNVYACYPKLVQ